MEPLGFTAPRHITCGGRAADAVNIASRFSSKRVFDSRKRYSHICAPLPELVRMEPFRRMPASWHHVWGYPHPPAARPNAFRPRTKKRGHHHSRPRPPCRSGWLGAGEFPPSLLLSRDQPVSSAEPAFPLFCALLEWASDPLAPLPTPVPTP
jgi:hypothetical protein